MPTDDAIGHGYADSEILNCTPPKALQLFCHCQRCGVQLARQRVFMFDEGHMAGKPLCDTCFTQMLDEEKDFY